MKICWDNLEKLEYRPDRGEWQKGKTFYVYKDSCQNCGDPFLAQKQNPGSFCSCACSVTGKNHPMYGKHHTDKSKEKMRKSHKNEKHYNWKGGYRLSNIPRFDLFVNKISYAEEVRRNKKDKNILEVKCAYCGKWFIPTIYVTQKRIYALEGKLTEGSEARFYCSNNCKKECPIYRKIKYSAEESQTKQHSREVQPELRQMCFERDDFTCQKCGKTQDELDMGLHCHHVEGIRWEPLESADLDMVITFCKNCHIEVHKQPNCSYHDMRCME